MWIADLTNPFIVLAGGLFVVGLLGLQMRRRRVSIRGLWVTPVVLVALTVWTLIANPPDQSSGWLWLGLALCIGLVMGAVRGVLVDVRSVDTAKGALLVQNTRLGVLVWLVAFVGRIVVRQVAGRSDMDASALGVVTTALLVAALGVVISRSIAMYFAYQSLKRSMAW
jgi:membrane protein CcdC involved in cytochrome C biogenesis